MYNMKKNSMKTRLKCMDEFLAAESKASKAEAADRLEPEEKAARGAPANCL